jgi:hypothetical protein
MPYSKNIFLNSLKKITSARMVFLSFPECQHTDEQAIFRHYFCSKPHPLEAFFTLNYGEMNNTLV